MPAWQRAWSSRGSTRKPTSPTSWATAYARPAVGEAYLADPFVVKEFSVVLLRAVHDGHVWLREHAANFSDPVLLLHGGDDGLVSPQDSIDMYKEVSATDKSLRIYAGLYHEIFNEFKRDRSIRDAIEWLDDRAR